MKRGRLIVWVALWALVNPGWAVETVRVGSGFSQPLYVTAPPGDTERLFVVEKGGAIRILDLQAGAVDPTAFLTATVSTDGERGLLGLAFHPDYATNGKFYVNLTNLAGNTEIREYTVSSNPNVADPASERLVLTFNQPQNNHNGGWLGFGPNDGHLYIMTGDGGGSNDNQTGHTVGIGNAQDLTDNLLGKVLRIDINGDDFAADPNRNYAIPSGNPFVGVTGDDEIWAYGLRNPWRASFDRLTGDLYIGDVGQSAREEIDFQSADSTGGENYGWRLREGTIATPSGGVGGPAPPDAVDPIYEYTRGSETFQGRAVTGGYVYRGELVPELQGTYFFGDFVDSRIWSFEYDGAELAELTDWTSALNPGEGSFTNFSSFGEGGTGELYIVSFGGDIYQIVPEPGVAGLLAVGGWWLVAGGWRFGCGDDRLRPARPGRRIPARSEQNGSDFSGSCSRSCARGEHEHEHEYEHGLSWGRIFCGTKVGAGRSSHSCVGREEPQGWKSANFDGKNQGNSSDCGFWSKKRLALRQTCATLSIHGYAKKKCFLSPTSRPRDGGAGRSSLQKDLFRVQTTVRCRS